MQQHDTWWFSYYRRPGLLIVGDVMMALAVVVPYTWDYHGHWLKCLSFTIGKSFLFFLEKTLLDDKLNMCECMWKTVPVLLSLPSLINSSLVSGIETNHLLILCKSFRTGKCSRKSLVIVNGISESFSKLFLPVLLTYQQMLNTWKLSGDFIAIPFLHLHNIS